MTDNKNTPAQNQPPFASIAENLPQGTMLRAAMGFNPLQFAKNIAELMNTMEEIISLAGGGESVSKNNWMSSYVARNVSRVGDALLAHILSHPGQWTVASVEAGMEAAQGYWQSVFAGIGSNGLTPQVADRRMKGKAWQSAPAVGMAAVSHNSAWKWLRNTIAAQSELDESVRRRALFYLDRVAETFSPANIASMNPEVIENTLASSGENLLLGARNLAKDMRSGMSILQPRHADPASFEVGKNIAATAGKVVFQNEVFQLIQYSPTTSEVKETPLLIYPPCINRYYILDLSARKSLVKWLVDSGYTVFLVSWVNPTPAQRHLGIEEYINHGFAAAFAAAKEISGCEQLNVVGYCIGGTMLATWLSLMHSEGNPGIKSATLLTAQVDFSDAGDLQVFIDEQQLADVEGLASESGIVPGWVLSSTFNIMRANDLVWPYLVANYLQGDKPTPFDILYWNADYTSLTAKLYSQYIRNYYIDNKLAEGTLEVNGVRADLSSIGVPVFAVAACDDHIAPAASVLRGMRKIGENVQMIVADSGHVAGMINPPAANKYGWAEAALSAGETFEQWREQATHTSGSWWTHWEQWLRAHSGDMVSARAVGESDGFPIIEDAPGSYVLAGGPGKQSRQ